MAQHHVGAPRDGTMSGGGADMVPFGSVVTAEYDAGVYTDVRNPLIRPVLVSTVKLYIVSVALEKHT
jgi:hypothetical protein